MAVCSRGRRRSPSGTVGPAIQRPTGGPLGATPGTSGVRFSAARGRRLRRRPGENDEVTFGLPDPYRKEVETVLLGDSSGRLGRRRRRPRRDRLLTDGLPCRLAAFLLEAPPTRTGQRPRRRRVGCLGRRRRRLERHVAPRDCGWPAPQSRGQTGDRQPGARRGAAPARVATRAPRQLCGPAGSHEGPPKRPEGQADPVPEEPVAEDCPWPSEPPDDPVDQQIAGERTRHEREEGDDLYAGELVLAREHGDGHDHEGQDGQQDRPQGTTEPPRRWSNNSSGNLRCPDPLSGMVPACNIGPSLRRRE